MAPKNNFLLVETVFKISTRIIVVNNISRYQIEDEIYQQLLRLLGGKEIREKRKQNKILQSTLVICHNFLI